MTYTTPAVEAQESITEPFVLGIQYITPTWTENEHEESS
jgi:hypothetical protein